MQISGNTRVFFILGSPVAQVMAPQLFNPLFKRHGVDAVLVPTEVAPAHLADFVRSAFKASNLGGLWVTIPHKAALLPLLAHCERRGQLAQAVNAVRRHADGTLEGALFDGQGFVAGLAAAGVACAGQRALVVGVGGAGTAIAVSLAEQGVAELWLHGLDPEATRAVAARLTQAFPAVQVQCAPSAHVEGSSLVINATPLGLRISDPLPFDPRALSPDCTVVDILMKPLPTPLVLACRARGLKAHMGHDMLLQQVPNYLEYFGYRAIADSLRGNGGRGLNDLRQQLQAEPALC